MDKHSIEEYYYLDGHHKPRHTVEELDAMKIRATLHTLIATCDAEIDITPKAGGPSELEQERDGYIEELQSLGGACHMHDRRLIFETTPGGLQVWAGGGGGDLRPADPRDVIFSTADHQRGSIVRQVLLARRAQGLRGAQYEMRSLRELM